MWADKSEQDEVEGNEIRKIWRGQVLQGFRGPGMELGFLNNVTERNWEG